MHDLFSTDTFYQIIYQFVFQLTLAVTAPVRQGSDIYWLYLLCALVIAVIVSVSQLRNLIVGQTWAEKLFGFLKIFNSKHFSTSLWAHPSALLDIRYYLVNAVVFPCVFAPLALQNDMVVNALHSYYLNINSVLGLSLGSVNSMVNHSTWFEAASFSNLSLPFDISLKLIYTLAFFIAYDAGRFIAHSLLHDVRGIAGRRVCGCGAVLHHDHWLHGVSRAGDLAQWRLAKYFVARPTDSPVRPCANTSDALD